MDELAVQPDRQVLPVEHLAKVVGWARSRGTVVASDECYIDLGWESTPVSILHPDVCGGDHTGLLAVHSLSKRSNMAGYRAGFVSGDPAIVASLIATRRHLGAMVPTPVQAAAQAALEDDAHVLAQRSRYGHRREILRDALEPGRVPGRRRGRPVPVVHPERAGDAHCRLVRRAGHPGRPGSVYGTPARIMCGWR